MAYPWIVPLFGSIAILALAVIVNRRGPVSGVSQVFVFLACMLVFWNLNFFVLYSVSDPNIAFRLTRVFRIGSLFMPPAIVHLILSLKRDRSHAWKNALLLDYGLGTLLVAANAADALASGLRRFPWGYSSVAGPFYNLFSGFIIVNCTIAIAILLHDYLTSSEPQLRLQLRFWLLGAFVALPLGLTNLLPSYGVPFYPLGSLGNVVWAGIVAYAIVRHRLMDIDVVLTKGGAYAAVSFVLLTPVFLFLLWLQQRSFGHADANFSIALLLVLMTVGVLFPTLRVRAESQIERSLFRGKHDYRAALSDFTRSIVRILDRERLVRTLASTLSETLQLDRIAIALVEEGKSTCTICSAIGPFPSVAEFSQNHPLIGSLASRQQAVLRDELETSTDHAERSVAAEVYRPNGWEATIPLTAGTRVIGLIGLGRKRNLDPFFAGDLSLLETLGAEASIALENARLYEELKRSQEIIRRADRLSALGTLAAGIAHEVRNPLVSIQTFFQLAPERLQDEEFFTSFLSMTAGEVKRISDLISELLSFARSPTRMTRTVDVSDTVQRVAALLEPEARKHQLTLSCTLGADPLWVSADADQLKQVLINLILNAIQATPAGGSVCIATRSVPHRELPFAQIEIQDTGVGIPPDHVEHIFDPFFTTKDKGTGLGLAIAHQIIAEHGGLIRVESNEGKGTSFFVDLPTCEESDVASAPGEPRTETEASAFDYTQIRKVAS